MIRTKGATRIRRRRHRTAEDVVVDAVVYTIMAVYAVITLVPFMNVVAKAFSEEWALVSGRITVWPVGFQINTLRYVISSNLFTLSFQNSLLVTFAGTLVSIVVTGLAAYPLSKRRLPFRGFFMIFFIFTMLFNGGMIPTYLTMKNLKLTNTLWVLFLPGALNCFNMLLIKNYYESLPESLEESARIDGANNLTILVRIVLPLALPVFATVCLFTAVGLWNDYYSAMIYNTRTSVKTLPLYLRDIITDNVKDMTMVTASDDMMNILPDGVRAATIVASTVPILVVYPFLQKYFIKGVLIGSVKG